MAHSAAAQRAALNLLQALARTLTGNYRLPVRWADGESYTDGQGIWVDSELEYAQKLNLGPGARLRCQRGHTAHEAFHILWTNFPAWLSFLTDAAEGKFGFPAGLVRAVGNICEDGRIELWGANQFPGALEWIRLKNLSAARAAEVADDPVTGFVQGLLSWMKIGVFPPGYPERHPKWVAWLQENAAFLEQVRRSRSTEECLGYVPEILRRAEAAGLPRMNPEELPKFLLEPPPSGGGSGQVFQGEPGPLDPRLRPSPPRRTVSQPDEDTPDEKADEKADAKGRSGHPQPDPPGDEEGEKEQSNQEGQAGPDREDGIGCPPDAGDDFGPGQEGEPELGSGEEDVDANGDGESFDDIGTDAADVGEPEDPGAGCEDAEESVGTREETSEEDAGCAGGGSEAPGDGWEGSESDRIPSDAGDGPPGGNRAADGKQDANDADAVFAQLAASAEAEELAALRGAEGEEEEEEPAADPAETVALALQVSREVPVHYGVRFEEHLVEPLAGMEEVYEKVQASVQSVVTDLYLRLRPLVARNREDALRAERSGSLDMSRVWRLKAFGDTRVFQHRRLPNDPAWAVYLLVDASGSMDERVRLGFTRADLVKVALVAIAGALERLKVAHTVTFFRASGGEVIDRVTHGRLVRWGQRSGRAALVSWWPDHNNRDGFSIRVATKEVLKRPEPVKLLLVLSDGQPESGGYHSLSPTDTGVRDTAAAVAEAIRAGVEVVGFYFGRMRRFELSLERTMFGSRMIPVPNLERLPMEVARMLRQIVGRYRAG